MPTMLGKPGNRPSPSLLFYDLAFRALRRIALPGDARHGAASPSAAADHHPRRVLCPADRVVLESAQQGETGSGARCSLCLPDDVQ